MDKEIKNGDSVKIIRTGDYGIITDIQHVHDRYQLKGISGWQHGIENIEKQNNESLHEEMASLWREIGYRDLEIKRQIKHGLEKRREIVKQEQQIEHHKAIAELAVKALEWYGERLNWEYIKDESAPVLEDRGDNARTALSSIQRLLGGSETP